MVMREHEIIFLILVLAVCMFTAGCVQVSGSSPLPPAVPATVVPVPEPEIVVPAIATRVPTEVVTVVRYTSLPRKLRDSELLFTLEVPAEWNVSTYRLMKSDFSDFRTELVPGDIFSIYSYPVTDSREQDFRDRFRGLFPATSETALTINGIRYDRFEGKAGGNTTVAYIVRATSANEHGYVSVLLFTARDSHRFELEDFENVVSSFRYFGVRSAAKVPGEEIPLYDVTGNAISRKEGPVLSDSSDWDMGEGGSFDTDSQGGSSGPAGGGSPGGGCQR